MRRNVFLVLVLFAAHFAVCPQPRSLTTLSAHPTAPPTTTTHRILHAEQLLEQLATLTADLLHTVRVRHCLTIITDDLHHPLFGARQFAAMARTTTTLLVRIADHEDTLRPDARIRLTLRAARRAGCDAYFVYLANGIQAERLLRYADQQRAVDTRAKFVLLYDDRLFEPRLHYLWRRFVNVVFVRQYDRVVLTDWGRGSVKPASGNEGVWFELSTVPYPNPIRTVFVARRLDWWRGGRFQHGRQLFADKTVNLAAETLRSVVLQHTPAVAAVVDDEGNIVRYAGLEVEILNAIAGAMNFTVDYYETPDAVAERWGHVFADNQSASGLIGEMLEGRADFALADLYYDPYHLDKMDLSVPYGTQCLTFMTPESLTDNSWQTLVLPFSGPMWAGVLAALLVVVAVFYALGQVNLRLRRQEAAAIRRRLAALGMPRPQRARRLCVYKMRVLPQAGVSRRNLVTIRYRVRPKEECPGLVDVDMFESFGNCLLYTYSMLMVVSLPRLPRSWSVRMMTGWYWTYCILVVVAYRASLTAILANPAPRLAIDTLKELANSPIECGAWGDQIRQFFLSSLDESSQLIGNKLETINNIEDAVQRVTEGRFAFYESEYVLQQQRSRRGTADTESLHIMQQCAIHMPIAIGLERNSPLRDRFDALLRRLVESGLTGKWLAEARRSYAASVEAEPQEALMELRKLYGALVALGVGHGCAALAALAEVVWWRCVVMRRPGFDRYAMGRFYARQGESSG